MRVREGKSVRGGARCFPLRKKTDLRVLEHCRPGRGSPREPARRSAVRYLSCLPAFLVGCFSVCSGCYAPKVRKTTTFGGSAGEGLGSFWPKGSTPSSYSFCGCALSSLRERGCSDV